MNLKSGFVSKINFFLEDIPPFQFEKVKIRNFLTELIKEEKFKVGEISVVFCSDDYLLRMNREYLNHDFFTDIITFDYTLQQKISGDLFISTDRVKDNAVTFGTTFDQELYRVIFHGVLHLAGYPDKEPEEERLMREKENYYLSKFDILND